MRCVVHGILGIGKSHEERDERWGRNQIMRKNLRSGNLEFAGVQETGQRRFQPVRRPTCLPNCIPHLHSAVTGSESVETCVRLFSGKGEPFCTRPPEQKPRKTESCVLQLQYRPKIHCSDLFSIKFCKMAGRNCVLKVMDSFTFKRHQTLLLSQCSVDYKHKNHFVWRHRRLNPFWHSTVWTLKLSAPGFVRRNTKTAVLVGAGLIHHQIRLKHAITTSPRLT